MNSTRLALLAATASLLLCGQAQAVTLVNPDGTPSPYQQWANELRVPTVRATLILSTDVSVCASDAGCTYETPPGDTIWFSAATAEAQGLEPLSALAHELGHQFAGRLMSEGDRAAYEAVTTFTGVPWLACQYGNEQRCEAYPWSPQESFANTYANCAVEQGRVAEASGPDLQPPNLIDLPTQQGYLDACALISRVAAGYPSAVDTGAVDPVVAPQASKRKGHLHRRRHHRHRHHRRTPLKRLRLHV